MSKGDNSPGVSRLAGAIRELADVGKDGNLLLDFGTIQGDGSLLTNTYQIPIPKGDYIVCRHLKSRNVTVSTTATSVGDHGSHRHSATVETREALRKGDRVLVGWVQNDAVVIDVILPADSVL